MQQPNQPIEQDEVPASPEEEQQLQQATEVALDMIHKEGAAGDNIAAMVLKSRDIAKGVGQATAVVVIGVEKTIQLSDDVKLALAEEVVDELVGLAIEAGALAEDEVTEEFVDQAVSNAYAQYMQAKEAIGELNQQQLAASVESAKGVYSQAHGHKQQARGGLLNRTAE